MIETSYEIKPIGVIRSELASREAAPRQGSDSGWRNFLSHRSGETEDTFPILPLLWMEDT